MNHGGLNIADWLEGLGMAGYAGRFAENRIDISVLPELSDQDLKDHAITYRHPAIFENNHSRW